MCICFCCCNCCNSYSSKCVEFSILTLSSIIFVCTLLNIIIIKFSHLSIACFILLIISLVFSSIIIILSICIIIYRKKGTINKNKNSISICFAYIGLFMSLIIFIITLVSESLIQAYFNDINHPCKEYTTQLTPSKDNNAIYFRILSKNIKVRNLSDIISDKSEFCKDKDKSYNAKIVSDIEYTISYFTASFIEFSCLILCFFWFNESKRLKRKVDGAIIINRMDFNEMAKRQSMYRGNIDPIDSYLSRNNPNINQNSDYQSQTILVNSKKNRRNTAFNLNFSRDSGRKNFISNLRNEIKNGMEIVEEDETKNKEIKENKDNINNSKMNSNRKKRNSILRKSKIEDNDQKNNDSKNDNLKINNNINNNNDNKDNNENNVNNDNKDNNDNNVNNDNKDNKDNNCNNDNNINNGNNEDIIVKKNSKRKSRGSVINIKKRRKSKIRKSQIDDLDIYNAKNNELNNMEKEENIIKYIKEENDENIIDPLDIPPKE